MQKRLKDYYFESKDIVYLYDNASSHTGGWSGWWTRSMNGKKITIPPYTPAYNPVEHFFNTVKAKFVSSERKTSIPKMVAFVTEKIEQIPKEKFVNYFLCSFYSMTSDLIRFNEPETYGASTDKIYASPQLKLDHEDKYKIIKGRYIVKDQEWEQPANFIFPKPEVEAGQTRQKFINKPQKVKKFDNLEEWKNYDENVKQKDLELFGQLRKQSRNPNKRKIRKPRKKEYKPRKQYKKRKKESKPRKKYKQRKRKAIELNSPKLPEVQRQKRKVNKKEKESD